MKSVDLQTTVVRSSEVSRDLRTPVAQGQSQAQEMAIGAVQEAQRISRSVRSTVKVAGKRVETRKEDRGNPKRDKRKRDPGSGELLDVTCDS